jgi:hypothetical protein
MSAGDIGSGTPVHAAEVLADRIAAALVHREPGWRLPRRSALARRYNVSMGEIDVAIRDLVRRSLVRWLPDGQLYRASPAEYWIPVEGATGLGTRLDPMGSPIECQARHVSLREAPQDVAWAIGVPAGVPVRVVRCVWTLAGEPAALSTTYLPEPAGGRPATYLPEPAGGRPATYLPEPAGGRPATYPPEPPGGRPATHSPEPPGGRPSEPDENQDQDPGDFGGLLDGLPGLSAKPAAVSLEMCPPQPSAARSLRLTPGQPVITVTIRFENRELSTPAGLTVVMLRPQLFRVAIDTAVAAKP